MKHPVNPDLNRVIKIERQCAKIVCGGGFLSASDIDQLEFARRNCPDFTYDPINDVVKRRDSR